MERIINSGGRHLPEEGWKGVWRDPQHNDDTLFHEDDAVAMLRLARLCESHPQNVVCLRCLPRLEAAIAAARRAVDPEAPALVEETNASGEFPEQLALVNLIAGADKKAFVLRLETPKALSATKFIYTSKRPEHVFERPVMVLDYMSETSVVDVCYLRAFHVRLGEGVPEAYTKRLWDARFSLSIDGELMVKERPLRELLGQKEIPLPGPISGHTCLFAAHRLNDDGESADLNGWVGYMLPHGTRVRAELDKIPGGGGLIQLKIGWSFGLYTTKKKPATQPND